MKRILLLMVAMLLCTPFIDASAGADTGTQTHSPIYIDGNNGFSAASGAVGGKGTSADPYVISGWEISIKEDYASAIRIENTDAYVIIRNVKVSSEKGNGIKLFNVSNVKIENVEIADSTYGIHLNLVSNVNITHSIVSRNYIGIYLNQWSGVQMYWNAIRNKDIDIFNDGAESTDVSQNWFGSNGAKPKAYGSVSCENPLTSLFKTVDFYYKYSKDGNLTLKANVQPEIFSAGCEWDLGDENITIGDLVNHTYANITNYTVGMRLWNKVDGSTEEAPQKTISPGTSCWPEEKTPEEPEQPRHESKFPVDKFAIALIASVGIIAVIYYAGKRWMR